MVFHDSVLLFKLTVNHMSKQNNMNEWITDRAPVKEDCNGFRKVWTIISSGRVCMIEREFVEVGDPWMPIIPPDPPEPMNHTNNRGI